MEQHLTLQESLQGWAEAAAAWLSLSPREALLVSVALLVWLSVLVLRR
jgi:hypothetical protein